MANINTKYNMEFVITVQLLLITLNSQLSKTTSFLRFFTTDWWTS